MKHLIQRVEQLENKVFGIVQGNYQLETNEPEISTCTWDLKDNIPVAPCQDYTLIPDEIVAYVSRIAYCPFCGRPIEVIN